MKTFARPNILAGLLKGGLYKLLYMGFIFVSGLIIAAMAGASIFGIIALMIANAAIFQIITGLGTDSSIVWHGSGGGFQKNKLFSFALLTGLLQVALFILLSLLIYQVTGQLLLSWQRGFDFFWYELLYFTSLVMIEKYISLMYAQQRAVECNKVLAFASIAVLIGLALLYAGLIQVKANMIIIFSCINVIPALALLFYYHLRLRGVFTARITREEFQSFFQFSMVVFVTNLVQFIAYRADYWLIDFFRNTEQVGVYAQATRFAQLLWLIPNILAGLLSPVIARGTFDRSKLLMVTRVLCYFNLFLVIIIGIVSWLFYTFFLGRDFLSGYNSLLIMMPGYYFFCLNLVFAAWFSAQRLLWVNFAGSSICLSLILLADYLLIPFFGINGAALANTIAYTAAGIFHVFMFRRTTHTGITEIFRFDKNDWRRIINLQS